MLVCLLIRTTTMVMGFLFRCDCSLLGGPLIRILIAMPHFFGGAAAETVNRSRFAGAQSERLRALIAAISGLHQTLGTASFGLDHYTKVSRQMAPPHTLDVVICTAGDAHLLKDIKDLAELFRHHATAADPLMLGFECHKVLRDARGGYDYYGYLEDDIVIVDPLFFTKRRLFDEKFGPHALLQPNRYEASPLGPMRKLYVDYRINPQVTARFQDIAEEPRLDMPFLDSTVRFERTPYPSAGCFFLNDAQLTLWTEAPHFLDGDVSYMSPLDSAVTLSVMRSFRVYKPVLDNASFLELLHASPRWISIAAQQTRVIPSEGYSRTSAAALND
jgi:hypothetical protein